MGIGALFEAESSQRGQGRNGEGNNGGMSRGRYSGRELRPEQLLHQLEPAPSPQLGSPAARRYQHPPKHARMSPRKSTPREALPEDLDQARQTCCERSAARDLAAAWLALQNMERIRARSQIDCKLLWNSRLSAAVSNMLYQSTESWLHSFNQAVTNRALPTPYHILLELTCMGSAHTGFIRPVLWRMTAGLNRLRFSSTSDESVKKLAGGLGDLVRTWRLCMLVTTLRKSHTDLTDDQDGKRYQALVRDETDWTFLPPVATLLLWTRDQRSNLMFEEVLSSLVPASLSHSRSQNKIDPRRADFASAALVTWDLLQSLPQQITPSPLFLPFTSLLGDLLKASSPPRIPECLRDELAAIEEPVLMEQYTAMLARLKCDHVETVLGDVRRRTASKTTSKAERQCGDEKDLPNAKIAMGSSESQVEQFATTANQRLGRALEQQNQLAAENLRREIYDYSHVHGPDAVPIALYEQLLLVFLSLKDAKTAIGVWNHMLKLGYKPNLKTYTVMMRGAQKSRDLNGLELFWQKMRLAGFKPDAYAWSIRIVTLLKLKSIKAGLDALDEMSQAWLAAAEAKMLEERPATGRRSQTPKPSPNELIKAYGGPINDVARPTLEVMNSAIAALATFRQQEVPKVFSWGRSFGIEPDLYTYNALLSLAMRSSRTDEAFNILKRMQEHGIYADSTTWTVLLNALFESGFLDDIKPFEQQDRILAYIDSLADPEHGLPGIDDKGYALVIDRLIKNYGNSTGAAAVFAHMLSKGHQPTPHIYTILMTSYFQRKPEPAFAAIESLWQQMLDRGAGFSALTDSVFFDRMIEGYARNHRIVGMRPMEDFLKHCRKSGKQPGWSALLAAARVYVERNQPHKMRNLLDEVKILYSKNDGRTRQHGEREFRAYVNSTGMAREERNPLKEKGRQLMRAADGAIWEKARA